MMNTHTTSVHGLMNHYLKHGNSTSKQLFHDALLDAGLDPEVALLLMHGLRAHRRASLKSTESRRRLLHRDGYAINYGGKMFNIRRDPYRTVWNIMLVSGLGEEGMILDYACTLEMAYAAVRLNVLDGKW